MTKTFSPIQKLAAASCIFAMACGVPLALLTSKLRDESGMARLEWEAGRRSLASKDRCAESALAGVRAAQRVATSPGRVSKEAAEKIQADVAKACEPESPAHGDRRDLGIDLGGHPVGVQDGGQDAATRG